MDCSDNSRNMYSVDYDSLIEKLVKTRDEIDDTIRLLENKKAKDNVINNILSQEDEEEESLESKFEDKLKELQERAYRDSSGYTYKVYYPYKYPFRWYPTVWF